MARKGRIHIGTSGWNYNHWKGPFYPEDLPASKMLEYIAQNFHTVELNTTFYHLPSEKAVVNWRSRVPDDFFFAVKASRYITHIKKLNDPVPSVQKLFERIHLLEDKLGPILFQLPPAMKLNLDKLKTLLDCLPQNYRYAFEFRNDTWFDDQVYDLLSKHNMAFCIYEINYKLSPRTVTADYIYTRLHGPDGSYQGQYDDATLSDWAGFFKENASKGKDVYCYFDNDQAGFAAQDALRLQQLTVQTRSKQYAGH